MPEIGETRLSDVLDGAIENHVDPRPIRTTVPLTEKQRAILVDAAQGAQMAQAQQNLAIATVLAGHDLDMDDCPNLAVSADGKSLQWDKPAPEIVED